MAELRASIHNPSQDSLWLTGTIDLRCVALSALITKLITRLRAPLAPLEATAS